MENNALSSLHYLLRNRLVSLCVWREGAIHPPYPPLACSLTIYVKTTVHCSTDSSMFECQASCSNQNEDTWFGNGRKCIHGVFYDDIWYYSTYYLLYALIYSIAFHFSLVTLVSPVNFNKFKPGILCGKRT
jgi:hypothetical protein